MHNYEDYNIYTQVKALEASAEQCYVEDSNIQQLHVVFDHHCQSLYHTSICWGMYISQIENAVTNGEEKIT